MVRQINIVETAKIIRQELKAAFPGIKFSVRTERYSMGSHCVIRWSVGPTQAEVEAVADRFYGKDYDEMTGTTYHTREYNGETVQFSGSSPECIREAA